MNDERPESSEQIERRLTKPEAGGLNPPRGFPSATWLYVIVRKEMTGGALLAQVAHASSEAASQYTYDSNRELPCDTRACILGATKDELAKVRFDLEAAEVPHRTILETDGPLKGCTTALGVVTDDRETLRPMLGTLRPWRAT